MDKKTLEDLRKRIVAVMAPIKPVDSKTAAKRDFLFHAKRTDAGRRLPEYYLVYFLLVELLQFRDLGRYEKVSWSVPIDYEGRAFMIEHRKFGLGIFAEDPIADNAIAEKIAKKIRSAVKMATPYFQFIADEAAKKSKLNVTNKSAELYERYLYFIKQYRNLSNEAERRKNERIVKRKQIGSGYSQTTIIPSIEISRNAGWAALAAIEAFFSWTEHVLIHLSILRGKIATGEEVADLAEADWQAKFKSAFDIKKPDVKKHYDDLSELRRQLRNFIAHGAFGKGGEAFSFHSGAGAVPLVLPHKKGSPRFSFDRSLGFVEEDAVKIIESFFEEMWDKEAGPAKAYIESDLPSVLTFVVDGTYAKAMKSSKDMDEFIDYLIHLHDQAANMDY